MYKVFIKEKILIFSNQLSDKNNVGVHDSPEGKVLITPYLGKQKFLYHFIDTLEKSPNYTSIIIYCVDLEKAWQDFQDIYKNIEAAGGVIYNENKEILMIYRLKTWDLPKGKIDNGETPEQAAVREIEEETGVKDVKMGNFICHTYHTYELKGKRILKKTYWYTFTTHETTLTPQLSENIEKAVWVDLTEFLSSKSPVYKSILDVLENVTK